MRGRGTVPPPVLERPGLGTNAERDLGWRIMDGTVQLYDPNALMSRTTTAARKMNNSRKNKTNQEGQEDGFASSSSFTNNIGVDSGGFTARRARRACWTTLQNAHAGAVRGLDFNPFSSNLLASGGRDGELSIWDINDPTKPNKYPALASGRADLTPGKLRRFNGIRKCRTFWPVAERRAGLPWCGI